MDFFQLVLCAIGAFYAFAGHIATRAALTSLFVDRAIAALETKPVSRAEFLRSCWLLTAATLVLAGGLALLFLLEVSRWLFLASALGQAVYLFWLAPRYLDIEDPPDPLGRRRSINAFAIYLVATAIVIWADASGRLESWDEAGVTIVALATLIVAAHIGYVLWSTMRSPAYQPMALMSGEADVPVPDPALSTRIHLCAELFAHPLWALDDDKYGDFPPEELGLSARLVGDLRAWIEAFNASYDAALPTGSKWSDAELAAHKQEARALAVRVAREKPDRQIYISGADRSDLIEIGPDNAG
jgi:hypothetical protein